MGASPPNPQDLTLPCHPRVAEHRSEITSPRPGLAPQSALGSHPCGALSSAEVRSSVPNKRRKSRPHQQVTNDIIKASVTLTIEATRYGEIVVVDPKK